MTDQRTLDFIKKFQTEFKLKCSHYVAFDTLLNLRLAVKEAYMEPK